MIIHEFIGLDHNGVYILWNNGLTSNKPTKVHLSIGGIYYRLSSPIPRSKLELACKVYNYPIYKALLDINNLPRLLTYSERVTDDYT